MVGAYVLVQTRVGRSSAVAQAIAGVAGVRSAEEVTGPYDVIAHIHSDNVDDLGRQVIAQIQEIPDITRTTTCTVTPFS